jgi:hypothetical protein
LQALYLGAADPTLAANSSEFANKIVDYRSGDDKIEGTVDDNPCISQGNISSYIQLAFSGVTVPTLVLTNLAVKSTYFRLEIQVASSDNKVIKNTTVILDTSGKVKLWQEE